ncbi:MAG: S-methyl-5'-thioinosine phosphorylase [Candidatus Aenigmarchaeota archaeon]|nr:S-methyl-5'-thioinosine phosphorylase [Candidatus Aenigmarchaeota archaeon]
MEVRIGIIGGTGVYKIFEEFEELEVSTPYGSPSDKVFVGEVNRKKIAFLPRHGRNHSIPPHRINYRANVYAFKQIGAKYVIATSAVGIINTKIKPGNFVLLSDFVDMTPYTVTFFDEFKTKPVHVDMTEPYSEKLRTVILKCAEKEGIKIIPKAVYVNTKGPRFETPAEIKMFKKLGFDVVGMTSAYEATLFKEVGIEYASIALATNYACGIKKKGFSVEEVISVVKKKNNQLIKVLKAVVKVLE